MVACRELYPSLPLMLASRISVYPGKWRRELGARELPGVLLAGFRSSSTNRWLACAPTYPSLAEAVLPILCSIVRFQSYMTGTWNVPDESNVLTCTGGVNTKFAGATVGAGNGSVMPWSGLL